MPRTCTVCRHPKRAEIDQSLLAGESLRKIAQRSGVSATALFRHNSQHLPQSLVLAKAAEEEIRAETLFERLRGVNRETLEILREARGCNNPVLALAAIGRIEHQLELEAKLLGQMDDSTKIAIGIHVATQESPDYSAIPTERLLEARDLLISADAILNGEVPVSARPPEVIEYCPLPAAVTMTPETAGIQPALISAVTVQNGQAGESPAPVRSWKNWNE